MTLIFFIPAIIAGFIKVILFLTTESKKASNWVEAKSNQLLEKLPSVMTDEDYFKHGNNFLELGRNELALELYTKAIALNPLAEYDKTRAKVKVLEFDDIGALADYTKAIKMNPTDYEAY